MSVPSSPSFNLEVPLAFLLLPAKADGALRHTCLAAWAVKDQELPFAILNVAITGQAVGPQKSARRHGHRPSFRSRSEMECRNTA